jgi:hypothetical protein
LRRWHPRRISINHLKKAGNVWQYEPFVNDMTGLIVLAKYNAQTTLSCVAAMVMARVKPEAINDVMFVNHLATNWVMTVQIDSC